MTRFSFVLCFSLAANTADAALVFDRVEEGRQKCAPVAVIKDSYTREETRLGSLPAIREFAEKALGDSRMDAIDRQMAIRAIQRARHEMLQYHKPQSGCIVI